MKAIIVTSGSVGDVYPFISIGRELFERGHDVIILSNPYYKKMILDNSLDFYPIGDISDLESGILAQEKKENKLKRRLGDVNAGLQVLNNLYIKPMEAIYDYVCNNACDDTVLISHFLQFGSKLAQEKMGIPLIVISLAPYWLSANFDDMLCKTINKTRDRMGLQPVKNIMKDWMFSSTKLIGLFPEWFSKTKENWPSNVELTGFSLSDNQVNNQVPSDVKDFLLGDKSVIIFKLSTLKLNAEDFFQISSEICSRLGKKGIILSKFKDQLPDEVKPYIKHFDYFPLGELLPYASVIVHDGGIGTSAQALANGIPQLICPRTDEQRNNSEILKNLGVSDEVFWSKYKLENVCEKLDALMNSETIRKQCSVVSSRFKRYRPIDDVCRLVEQSV